jgi:hypothetical protein
MATHLYDRIQLLIGTFLPKRKTKTMGHRHDTYGKLFSKRHAVTSTSIPVCFDQATCAREAGTVRDRFAILFRRMVWSTTSPH